MSPLDSPHPSRAERRLVAENPEKQAPKAGAPGIASLRRGNITLDLPADAEGELPLLVQRIFQVPEIQEVWIEADHRRISVRFAFSAAKRDVLRKLAEALRGGSPATGVKLAAANLPRGQRLTLRRFEDSITTWRVAGWRPDFARCRHPLLSKSVEAAYAAEEALAVLPGIRSAVCNQTRGEIAVEYDPRFLDRATLLSALESSLANLHPQREFLAPSIGGYAFDGIQLALAATGQLALSPILSVSALLLVAGYRVQLRDAWNEARKLKLGWNATVSLIVLLTVLNGTYFHAAIMALAIRFWKSAEHREVLAAIRKARRGVSPEQAASNARLLARGVLAASDAPGRGLRFADAATPPTIVASAAALATHGMGGALAALRPDYYSGPRLATRLLGLATILRFARKDIFFAHLSCLRRAQMAPYWVLDGDWLESIPAEDARMIVRHLQTKGIRVGAYATASASESLPVAESCGLDFFQDRLSPEGKAWHIRKLAEAGEPVVYLGRPLPWANGKPADLVCFHARENPRLPLNRDSDAVLIRTNPAFVEALLQESHEFPGKRRVLETLSTGANILCTLGSVLVGIQTWQVVIVTNAATGLVYLLSRRELRAESR